MATRNQPRRRQSRQRQRLRRPRPFVQAAADVRSCAGAGQRTPFVKVPTAKRSLGNGKWEGGLLIPIGYSIPNSPLSIGLTPEVDWAADGDGRGHHAAMAQVASLGWQASDKLNLSAEIWGQWDWDPAGTTRQASADGAVAYLLGNEVQLDAGANVGLNRADSGRRAVHGRGRQVLTPLAVSSPILSSAPGPVRSAATAAARSPDWRRRARHRVRTSLPSEARVR